MRHGLTQLGAVAGTGGLVVLVGASGAGKSSLLNADLVPALRDGALGGDDGDDSGRARKVVQLVLGGDPLAELGRCVPELAAVVPARARTAPGTVPSRPEAGRSDASGAQEPGATLGKEPGPSRGREPGAPAQELGASSVQKPGPSAAQESGASSSVAARTAPSGCGTRPTSAG